MDDISDMDIEEASTKSNTDSNDSFDFFEPVISKPPPPRGAFLSMSNTRRAILNNPHFSSVARSLRQDRFQLDKEKPQEYKSEKNKEKEDKFKNPFINENPQSISTNIFLKSTERNFSESKPKSIFQSKYKPNWQVQNIVNYKPTIKAFDIRANPFHFLGQKKGEEKDE